MILSNVSQSRSQVNISEQFILHCMKFYNTHSELLILTHDHTGVFTHREYINSTWMHNMHMMTELIIILGIHLYNFWCNVYQLLFLHIDYTLTVGNDDIYERYALVCYANCPNQTASDVVWNVHLVSFGYNISLSCPNNYCTSNNGYTRLLQLEQNFNIDSNNTLRFYFSPLYERALMGCVVTVGDCLSTTYYYTVHGSKPYSNMIIKFTLVFIVNYNNIAKIFSPINGEVYHVNLGESLFIMCEADGDGDNRNLLYWRKGNSDVEQFTGHCYSLDINNSSCISSMYDKYRELRVKAYRTTLRDCDIYSIQRSMLDISILDWTDSAMYTCVTSKERINSERNVSVHIIVG